MVKKTSRAMKKNRGRKGRKGRKSDVAIPANAELDEHADVIRRIGRQSLQGAVEIGRRLVLCRKLLKAQRVWLAWIKKKFGWSRKHADNLIGLYLNRGKVAKFATFGVPLSALYLLSQQHARIVKNIERCTEPGKRPLVREIKEQVHRERTVIGMPTAADRAGALAASKLVAAGLHERGIREEQRRIREERRIREAGKLGDQESPPEQLPPAEQLPRPQEPTQQLTSADFHRAAAESFSEWLADVAHDLGGFEPAVEIAAALPAKRSRVDEDAERVMRFLDEFCRARRDAGVGKLKLVGGKGGGAAGGRGGSVMNLNSQNFPGSIFAISEFSRSPM